MSCRIVATSCNWDRAHYREITSPEQVEIYEDILGDPEGKVTTGLLAGVYQLSVVS